MNEVNRFHPALRRARALVLDVDGVLTDGRLYYGAKGESLKVFHVRDGHGIKAVAAAGVTVAIISGRKSPMVTRRARELGSSRARHSTRRVHDRESAARAEVSCQPNRADNAAALRSTTALTVARAASNGFA